MPWKTEFRKTNPLSGAVLADTGALDGPNSLTVFIIISSTVGAMFTIERRNAANDTTIMSQDFSLPGQGEFRLENLPYDDQERFRIVTAGAVIGTVQGSVMY